MYVKILKVHFLLVDTLMDYIVDALTLKKKFQRTRILKRPYEIPMNQKNLSQYTFFWWFYKIYYLRPKI
jgi:hypothetical protein